MIRLARLRHPKKTTISRNRYIENRFSVFGLSPRLRNVLFHGQSCAHCDLSEHTKLLHRRYNAIPINNDMSKPDSIDRFSAHKPIQKHKRHTQSRDGNQRI